MAEKKTETAEQKRKRQAAEQAKKDAAAEKAREEFDKALTVDPEEGAQTVSDKVVTERAIHEEAERREHGLVDADGEVVDPSIAPPAEADTHPEADYKVYGSPALGGEPLKPKPNKRHQEAKLAEQAQKVAQIPQGKKK